MGNFCLKKMRMYLFIVLIVAVMADRPSDNELRTRVECERVGGVWTQVRGLCGSTCRYKGRTIKDCPNGDRRRAPLREERRRQSFVTAMIPDSDLRTRAGCESVSGQWRQVRGLCGSTCHFQGRVIKDCPEEEQEPSVLERDNDSSVIVPDERACRFKQCPEEEQEEEQGFATAMILDSELRTRANCESYGGRWQRVRGLCGSTCHFQGRVIKDCPE